MSSPLRVSDLVERHNEQIRRASPSLSPPTTRRSLPGVSPTREGSSADAPTSPSPQSKELPPAAELQAKAAPEDKEDAGTSLNADNSADGAQDGKSEAVAPAQAQGLEGIQEDDAASLEEGEIRDDEGARREDQKADGEANADEPVDDKPLERITESIQALPTEKQEAVKATLARLAEYPPELPLTHSWTLHFSDTSGASKSSSAAATKDAYTEGITPVFTATTVPQLCGQLKAFKQAPKSRRAKLGDQDSLGLSRPGMNLHFFRTGISPTWEDPYNEKGGRITISPSGALFDSIYERLVLLCGGASLEIITSDLLQTEGPAPGSKRTPTPGPLLEGQINGVVASRRARGDRIEVWLGGKNKKEPVPGEWLDRLKGVLAQELEMPELAGSKYKKHF
ncbi:hypothetical protein Rhopal_003690-T1 [Rhodotorula paludigena]|uniref:Translation initiation factor eIF4e n=1 Tax=Rhodotorula paludigena TaxID=86838 RepID=A0AAV5GKD4_9BASI|nr:hypothetical protein Rhopal_003690-T1 [Rhodotorula paludigena]